MTSRSSTATKLPMKVLAPSWALVSLIKFPGQTWNPHLPMLDLSKAIKVDRLT